MLFRKNIVSTRTLLQLTAALVCLLGGVGAAFAANSGIAPLLVPYTIKTIAGNPVYPGNATATAAGYFGEGVPATSYLNSAGNVVTGATLDAPYAMAVDSVGNVYISDTGNYVIREVNAQTGLITTIAGVVPKGCGGITCTIRTNGCDDGVPAAGAKIGTGVRGITVDAFGNIYFVDGATSTVSVIYRGGAQVAAFIALENPTAVAATGGSAQVGYLYHVAGTITLGTCSSTAGNVDNALAFQNAQLHSPTMISLDGAGNIYVADIGNSTVRVINTQPTPQTFFQYTVQPGYMRSITDCSALLTTPCTTATTTSTANTGINGPVNALVYNSQYKAAEVDAFGNIYQLNGTGGGTGPPGIYSATTFAGGTPLINLLTAEAPSLAASFGPNATPTANNAPAELPLTYGNSYITIGNPAISSALPGSFPDVLATTNEDLDIRPSSLLPDNFGTFWFLDNHYPELERIDQYTSLATDVVGSAGQRATASVAGITGVPGVNYLSPANFNNQWYCVYGASGHPWTSGPQTYDPEGDGCPAILGRISGNYNTVSDGLGNIYLSDGGEQLMRELPLGNSFPATAVGSPTPVTQAIQVHFNSNNPPVIGSAVPDASNTGYTSNPDPLHPTFSIPGSDFAINTTTPEFPMGSLVNGSANAYGYNATTSNFQMYAGLPTCTQLGLYPTSTSVTDYDCLVYVTFNPTAPGMRQSQLVVTTQNGSTYNFPLYGVGVGPKLAIDGGKAVAVPAAGLGTTAAIAINSAGSAYIADPSNNRIVVCSPAATCATQTTIGPSLNGVNGNLSGPMGVAVDAANNVYISDTGNNRILELNPITNAATVLGANLWISGAAAGVQASSAPGASVTTTTAPPQYQFKAPRGIAVDSFNNVYVADTGNAAVVEIPSNIALGGAAPLLAYPGAPKFGNPVAVAVDSQNNIYVADTKNSTGQIVVLPPGGGDLTTVPNSQFPNAFGIGLTPNGVAVDAAGNIYASDSGNNVVTEIPAGSGPGTESFQLNFPGISTPAGLALDANGNLFVADSGNKQILFDNRQNPTVDFGTVAQDLTSPPTVPLTITNVGSQPIPLASPFTTNTVASETSYTVTNNTCSASYLQGPLPAGVTCSLTASFNPTTNGSHQQTVTVNGSGQMIALTANGESPLASVVLSAAYSTGTTPTAGATATISATATQPFVNGDTPSGSIVFSYTIQGDGTTGSQTVALSGSGGKSTASFVLPTLLQGRRYTINAAYTSSDTNSSSTNATPLILAVPGVPVTVTATSVSFVYGSPVPAITGTVTGITDPAVTYKFTSAATPSTPIGTYPITVVFSGGSYLSYGFPPAVTSTGAPAVVTETPASLTYKIPNFTSLYGAANISYGVNAVITGAVNGDTFGATFIPAKSSILAAGTYSVVPTVIGTHVGNYTVTAKPSTLTITPAPSGVSISAAQSAVLNTTAGVASATLTISVGTLVAAGKGIPTGSVVLTDNFTPITLTAPGTGSPAAPVTYTLALNAAGNATYTPIDPTPGTHHYSASYSGDQNFQCSVAGQATAGACATSGTATTNVLVDNPDFTVSSNTGVVNIIPGIIPSGNGLPPAANQSAAAPESAVISITGILGFAGNVSVTCTPIGNPYVTPVVAPPTYLTCTMTPPVSTLTASGTGATTASVLSVQTPATLPLGYFHSSVEPFSASQTVLAFLPLGAFAFCMRRRRRLSKFLWMVIGLAAIGAGVIGCGGNQVDFYTPVPTGPQYVTVTVSYTATTSSSIPSESRSFIVPISIN